MNEPLPSPTAPPPLPQSIPILTAIASTASVTFSIAFWVADSFLISCTKDLFEQLGAELPVATQLIFDRGGWGLMWLGAIWSGIFCYGAYKGWLSRRLARFLLVGTVVLTWAYAAIVFLALCLPFVAVMDTIG